MTDISITALNAEIEALRKTLADHDKDLYEALSALSDMWNQYCPPHRTHQHMSAGEAAEEVLKKWSLLRNDETSIYIDGMVIDKDIPQKVLNLLRIPPLLQEPKV